MTAEQSITSALKNYGRIKNSGADCLIVRRSDHPHIDGDYFYAIRTSDKHRWTDGEMALSTEEITALWYAADCPPAG